MKYKIAFSIISALMLMLLTFYSLSLLNREKVKKQFEKLTIAEGQTIRSLIENLGAPIAEKKEPELAEFLNFLFQKESLVYLGLFRNESLIYLLSQYEGYFPVSEAEQGIQIVDSPIGKILSIQGTFVTEQGEKLNLHLGFNYDFLSVFEKAFNQEFYLLLSYFSIILLFILFFHGYFERKIFNARLELEKTLRERENYRQISLLTAEIAHEIKNPLNSIYLSFNALETCFEKDKEAQFYRDAIKSEIRRINEIILSYSDLGREIIPRASRIEIDLLVQEVKFLTAGEISENNAELHYSPTGLTFNTDGNLLKQVFFNLIKNSLEAGAEIIELKIEYNKKKLIIAFFDNGKGIAVELRDKLFLPFSSTKIKGMGLGLHVVSKIVHALNGSIQLVSGDPKSTVFKIEIGEVD